MKKIKERDIEFLGGKDTLRKVLYDLGFKYKRNNGVRYLMEQPRIVLLRIAFLRRYLKAIQEGKKQFVYLDETWVFQHGSGLTKSWQDADIRSCPKRKASTGGRYIVVHAGGRRGFVKGAGKVWCSSTKPKPGDDYHGDMDGRIMKMWFTEHFLPNLDQPSIIVMDNASYHSCQDEGEKQPTSSSTKECMKASLDKQGIHYDNEMLRKELLALVKLNKKPTHYILEGLLAGTEHEILRLPPYHAIYNPIELVWGLLKRYFDAHVGRDQDFSVPAMLNIFEEGLATITPEIWNNICDKVEKRILEAYESEVRNDVLDPNFKMIINLQDDDSDDEEEDVDDPEPMEVITDQHRKLTKEELACGITFEEVLAPEHVEVFEEMKVCRSLSKRFVDMENNPAHPVEEDEDEDLGCLEIQDHVQKVVDNHTPELSTTCASSQNATSFASAQLKEYSSEHVLRFLSVTSNFSVAWSLIPERIIDNSEVEAAVFSIMESTCQLTQGFDVEDQSEELLSLIEHANINNGRGEGIATEERENMHCDRIKNASAAVEVTHSPTINDINLRSLLPHNIPTSEVVDWYFQCIKKHYSSIFWSVHVLPSNFFKKVITLESGFEKSSLQVDIFQQDIVFMPVVLGPICTLCVIWPLQRRIRYYDSMGNVCDDLLMAVANFLAAEHERTKGYPVNWFGWSSETATDICINNDIAECPVIVCCYARRVCEGLPCLFSLKNMHCIRQVMSNEIMKGQLQELPLLPLEDHVRETTTRRGNAGNLLKDCSSENINLDAALSVFGVVDAFDPTASGNTAFATSSEDKDPVQIMPADAISLEDHVQITPSKTISNEDTARVDSPTNHVQITPSEAISNESTAHVHLPTDHVQITPSKAISNENTAHVDSPTDHAQITPSEAISNENTAHVDLSIVIHSDSEDFISNTDDINSNVPMDTQDILKKEDSWIFTRLHGINLKVEDLKTLCSGRWLNDNVINTYMKMVCAASSMRTYAFSSFFYSKMRRRGYGSVQRWTKKVDIFSYDLLLIPVHQIVHWTLVAVDLMQKTITYYDSLGSRNMTFVNHIKAYLEKEFSVRKGGELSTGWTQGVASTIPKQTNSYDCGIFTCAYARCLSLNFDYWPFDGDNMAVIRERMMNEIVLGQLDQSSHDTLQDQGVRPILPIPYHVTSCPGAVLIQSGPLHQRATIFPADRRNAQCTAIAACALLAYAKVQRPFTWREMNDIILAGDELYIHCRTSAKAVDNNWLSADDLPQVIRAFGCEGTLKSECISHGVYSERRRIYELSDAIQRSVASAHLKSAEALCGYIFIGRSKTVSFWQGKDESFYFFNSHCVTKDNKVEEDTSLGAARLFHCDTSLALSKLIMAGDDFDNNFWSLATASVHVK